MYNNLGGSIFGASELFCSNTQINHVGLYNLKKRICCIEIDHLSQPIINVFLSRHHLYMNLYVSVCVTVDGRQPLEEDDLQ